MITIRNPDMGIKPVIYLEGPQSEEQEKCGKAGGDKEKDQRLEKDGPRNFVPRFY